MKYTTNFKGDTIKDPMRQKTLEDIDKNFWISNSNELQERIDKAIEYIENKTLSRKLTDRGIVCEIYDVYKLLDILKGSDSNG